MKLRYAIPIAATATFLMLPVSGGAQTMGSQTASASNTQQPNGTEEAMRMVPARAELTKTLDAKRLQPGRQFRAKLAQTVHLDNGVELPSGTLLIGTVARDDMQTAGTSRLALRFTEAILKDGKTIPIKATIVGLFGPESESAQGYPVTPGDQVPNSWNDRMLQIDQENVGGGVALHSRISSSNSGVFVAKDKDVKLRSGSELQLALAERNG